VNSLPCSDIFFQNRFSLLFTKKGSNDENEDLFEHHVEWQRNFEDVHSGLALTADDMFVVSALGEEGVIWDFETGRIVTSLKRPEHQLLPADDVRLTVLRTDPSDDMQDIACCLSNASVCLFTTSLTPDKGRGRNAETD